jgi:aromatic ring-opening dioxygenase catalytic subunit (LigB family)
VTDLASVIFIPHGGGPLPLLDEAGNADLNRFLRSIPETVTKPDAIVVFSAHWEEAVISITASASPPMLFDYHGFPEESYRYEYPAPGYPRLAGRVQELLQQAGIGAKLDSERGFDHGLFVPLLLMFPQADIPCIQVSLSASLDAAEHLRIGKALSGLKSENLLFLGSGFSFHNMEAFMSKRDDSVDPRNQAFEDWLAQTCCDDSLTEPQREARLRDWLAAPHARFCHPREEHLLPLQVCYGIGQSAARQVYRGPSAGYITSGYRWGQD